MRLELWYPVKGATISQKFGENKRDYASIGLKAHNGWDFACPTGTVVRAAHDGIVTFTGQDGAGGETVVVRTDRPYDYGVYDAYFKTIYVHNLPGTYKVKPGDRVRIGQPLVLSDNTGRSTGPHLHCGLKPVIHGEQDWVWDNIENDNGFRGAIDPETYWVGGYAEDRDTFVASVQSLIAAVSEIIRKKKQAP